MAERTEIIDEIERLAVHCRPPLMEPSARAGWMSDWCADLVEFPIEAIRLGIREWRHSGSAKFPTPGQLIPLVRAKAPPERRGERIADWREPTEEEYRAMSVRDKIRHHLIMAHAAGCKAGPMWRNPPGGASLKRPVPGHVPVSEMPPIYHHWKAQQDHHLAEVGRLRELIREPIAAE